MRKFVDPRRALLQLAALPILMFLVLCESITPARAEPALQGSTLPDAETSIYVPLIYHLRHNTREQTLFGTQMYGYSGYDRSDFQALNGSGAAWVRNELVWRTIEPENTSPENFNWRRVSQAIAAATDGNYNLILTVRYAPEWASDNTDGPINTANLSDFADFVGAVVERLDGDGIDDLPGSPVVSYFEFYNEPDRRPDADPDKSGWGYDPQGYATMLKTVAPAIRSANPDAKIVFGGLAYDWFEDQGGPFVRTFLDDVLAEDVDDAFDVFAFHAYPPFAVNWADHGPGVYEKAQFIRNKLAEYGLDKPLFITEAGMHSNEVQNYPPPQMNEEYQARYVVQLFSQALAADVDTMIWFSFVDPPEWYPYKNGLVTDENPPRKKLAYKAYQTTVKILTGARPDAVLSASETGTSAMQAYRFADDANGRAIYAAWMTPIDGTASAPLSLPGSTARITLPDGSASTVTDGSDGTSDGRITVSIGARPQYIEVIN
jgi:hypothetical protein